MRNLKNITVVLVFALLAASSANAQVTARGKSNAATNKSDAASRRNDLAARLPASDAAVLVDADKILTQALPRLLAGDAARLAQVNKDIDDFRTRTGVDARSFKQLALGMRFVTVGNATRAETVALAQGTFNANVLTAAGKLAANGKYREENYAGKRISIFTLNNQVKLLEVLKFDAGEVAVAPLADNVLALGTVANVKAAVDAASGRGVISRDVLDLAARNQNALISFGGNVPREFVQNIGLPSEELQRNLAAIRQGYGFVGMTPRGFEVVTIARTETNQAAQDLGNSIEAVKQFAPYLIAGMRGDEGRLARAAINNLKVTTNANEMRLNLEMSDGDLALLVPRLFGTNRARL